MDQKPLTTDEETTSFQIGDVEFNPQKEQLIFSRYRKVKLTTRESLILKYLLEHKNQAITLTEIMSQCLKSFTCEPMATRRTIQLLSTKLELVDYIEYPYIDCYRFHLETSIKHSQPSHMFAQLKRWFKGELSASRALV